MRKTVTFMVYLILMLVLWGCSEETNQGTPTPKVDEESSGGELQYAMSAQPPTLDPHMTTAGNTRAVSRNIFEGLVANNSEYEVVPMLAESWEISNDNKTYTFHLREGVKFHNGKEMTAEDVVASMNRWVEKSASIKTITNEVDFQEKDTYTVVAQLKEPSIFLLNALAGTNQFSAVMPKEVIDEAIETGVKEYIGTGPFSFVEWKQDQYIHLSKYENYKSLDTPASGLGGKKEALVDDIYFQFVEDDSTRLSGVQTGEYDYGDVIDRDMLEQIRNDGNLTVQENSGLSSFLYFNKHDNSMFSDIKMRQAVNAALNIDDIAKAAFGEMYSLYSGYMAEEQTNWYSEAGSEFYNNPDLSKVNDLLEEAGYDGEKIRLVTTRDYSDLYNSAVVIQEQLKNAGFEVELEVYDWPTLNEKTDDPTAFELSFTYVSLQTTPLERIYYDPNWFAGPLDDKTEQLLQAMKTAASIEEAKKIWDELQAYSWEFLPIIKIADMIELNVSTNKVEGLTFFNGPVLWNTRVIE